MIGLLTGPKIAIYLRDLGSFSNRCFFVFSRAVVTPNTTLLINNYTPHPFVCGTIHTVGKIEPEPTAAVSILRKTFRWELWGLALVSQGRGVVGLWRE